MSGARPTRSGFLVAAAAVFPYLACAAALLFFARRARFGLTAPGFGDETMHLLGGWALNSGERLYRNFVDLHGPGIFMLAQIYGVLFGWSHANDARLVTAGLAVLSGIAVATSPSFNGRARVLAAAYYFGLIATVWLVQGLYLFSYYPISGALAVIALAWFVLPAIGGSEIPAMSAAAAGIASALLVFTSISEAPSGVLFSAGGCLAAWAGGQTRALRAHIIAGGVTCLLLLGWLVIWGDLPGYLAFHVMFAITVFPKVGGPLTLRGVIDSLTPSLQADRLVQSVAVVFLFLGCAAVLAIALRRQTGRLAAALSFALAAVGLVLLNVRGLSIFQDGAFLMASIGWFALSVSALEVPYFRRLRATPLVAAALCLAMIAVTDLALRRALYSPTPMTRAQFLSEPPAPLASRQDGPIFAAIRRITRPDERILALDYSPQTYFAAGRLPIDRIYEYLPTDAIYAKAPWFGERRDLCDLLDKSPPPVIVFDNWAVWGIYKPSDYMPCLFKVLTDKYRYIPEPGDAATEAQKLYVRTDRAP